MNDLNQRQLDEWRAHLVEKSNRLGKWDHDLAARDCALSARETKLRLAWKSLIDARGHLESQLRAASHGVSKVACSLQLEADDLATRIIQPEEGEQP